MINAADILARIRSHGANVTLDGNKLVVVNRSKLPPRAMDFIKAHAKEIAAFLEQEGDIEERAAIMEHDGGIPRQHADDLAKLLHSRCPDEVDPADWTWFLGKAIQVLDGMAA